MTPSEILDYISAAPGPVTKRDIARVFRLKGSGPRMALKKILKSMSEDGMIEKVAGGYAIPNTLPNVTTVEVSEITTDGDVFAKPLTWNESAQGALPQIEIMPGKSGEAAVTIGDRALVRLKSIDTKTYEAQIIKRLDTVRNQVIGLLRKHKNKFILQPADKKSRHEFIIDETDMKGAKDGDLIIGELQPSKISRDKIARIVDVLGRRDDPKAISLISLHEAGLSEKWPDSVLNNTKGLKVPTPKNREDLRHIPLVTIDGADARDFDDAVWAEKTENGFHLIVAIADVSYYVRPASSLDKEALRRGNSTYFPDRVVPMLPEALSNDLCSLRPKEDRACMAMHMWVDHDGTLQRYKIMRGLMRSHARLIYEDVQQAFDSQTHEFINLINPLYAAFKVLNRARQKRGALDLDLPEKQIIIDDKGNMTGVKIRSRVDAHKVIEEFMILANVAAARALEDKRAPCVYRVHDRPKADKLDSVREFIQSFGLSFPKGQIIQPTHINTILKKAANMPFSHLISTTILRTQSQAVYHPENIGHFGLALDRYAHFTSPIRRYADLLVHRSLTSAYALGAGGLSKEEEARLDEICMDISDTERKSMGAERNAVDRFTAAFLAEHIGAQFEGRITGVTRFGLFVELKESGADGLVPIRSLPDDYYVHDEKLHVLIGKRKKRVFQLGAPVTVTLLEADGLTGSTILELSGHENGAQIPGVGFKPSHSAHSRSKNTNKSKYNDKKKHKRKKKKTTPKHKRKLNAKNKPKK